jgi:hypothetical protein
MENTTPNGLSTILRRWREEVGASGTLGRQDLDELESHLRDSIQVLEQGGLSVEEAFLVARRRLGEAGGLVAEFAKVNRQEIWLTRLIWIVAGILLAHALDSLQGISANLAVAASSSLALKGQWLGMVGVGARWLTVVVAAGVVWRLIGEHARSAHETNAPGARRPMRITLLVMGCLVLGTVLSSATQVLVIRQNGPLELGTMFIWRTFDKLLMPLIVWPGLLFLLLRRRAGGPGKDSWLSAPRTGPGIPSR